MTFNDAIDSLKVGHKAMKPWVLTDLLYDKLSEMEISTLYGVGSESSHSNACQTISQGATGLSKMVRLLIAQFDRTNTKRKKNLNSGLKKSIFLYVSFLNLCCFSGFKRRAKQSVAMDTVNIFFDSRCSTKFSHLKDRYDSHKGHMYSRMKSKGDYLAFKKANHVRLFDDLADFAEREKSGAQFQFEKMKRLSSTVLYDIFLENLYAGKSSHKVVFSIYVAYTDLLMAMLDELGSVKENCNSSGALPMNG
jgi:hypothetical protein